MIAPPEYDVAPLLLQPCHRALLDHDVEPDNKTIDLP